MGELRSVIWCSRFDLCLKFIIKSVSITARRAAGYQGQPNALLMRHSETYTHTDTHTHTHSRTQTHTHTHAALIIYKSENCNLPALLSLNECQCCVYGFEDVSGFLYSSLVRPGPVSLNTTTTDYYAVHHSLCLQRLNSAIKIPPPHLSSASAVLPSISD